MRDHRRHVIPLCVGTLVQQARGDLLDQHHAEAAALAVSPTWLVRFALDLSRRVNVWAGKRGR